jgi:hypothetical protein
MGWSPGRPSWRLPLVRTGRKNATFPPGFKRSQFGDGHPSRRQCKATAKGTGERCRRDALQGADRCGSHSGHLQAYRNAPAGFISTRSGPSAVRTALFRLQMTEAFPEGVPMPKSHIKRGLVIETVRNQSLGLTSRHFPVIL